MAVGSYGFASPRPRLTLFDKVIGLTMIATYWYRIQIMYHFFLFHFMKLNWYLGALKFLKLIHTSLSLEYIQDSHSSIFHIVAVLL